MFIRTCKRLYAIRSASSAVPGIAKRTVLPEVPVRPGQWRTGWGGGWGVQTPPEIPKFCQS
jgi:hypothetical protein